MSVCSLWVVSCKVGRLPGIPVRRLLACSQGVRCRFTLFWVTSSYVDLQLVQSGLSSQVFPGSKEMSFSLAMGLCERGLIFLRNGTKMALEEGNNVTVGLARAYSDISPLRLCNSRWGIMFFSYSQWSFFELGNRFAFCDELVLPPDAHRAIRNILKI